MAEPELEPRRAQRDREIGSSGHRNIGRSGHREIENRRLAAEAQEPGVKPLIQSTTTDAKGAKGAKT